MRVIQFDVRALEDLGFFVENDRKLASKILRLIAEITRTPFDGTGKPEGLRGDLRGYWSRRIDAEHRLVYEVTAEVIRIVSCRYHYDR